MFVRSPKLCNETNHKLFHHKDLHYCVGDPLKGEHRRLIKFVLQKKGVVIQQCYFNTFSNLTIIVL